MTEGPRTTPSCLDADTASAYAAHALEPAERDRVELHIDGCPACRELVSVVASLEWSKPGSSGGGEAPEVGGVLPRGTRVGPFEIDRPLDAGGMGLVYAAHDSRLERRVALKCVRERRGHSEQLLREARMMAQLAHPNVVPVYDVLDAHGQIFLAMELVVGRSLRQWLEAPRGWKAVVDVFLEAGAGLAAAHAAGIVHGDVKPANVLLGDDGRVRVTDFGLASLASEGAAQDGAIIGTPAYLAPEQRAGQPCDARADQYAFCVSLHEALFGALPEALPLRQPRLPRAVRRVLARGLSAEPGARYPSMKALLLELQASRAARWRWALAAAVTLLAVGLAYDVGGRRVERALCQSAAPELVAPWTAQARAQVEGAFARTGLSYAAQTLAHVEATLDAWSSRFEAARAQACQPAWFERGTPVDRLRGQLGCLSDRAREVRALVSLLREADATVVLNSTSASEQLGSIEACAASPAPAPEAPEGPAAKALSEKFATVHALGEAGKARQSLPLAKALVADARALGDQRRLGAALVSLGAVQARVSDFEGASGSLLEALRLTDEAHDDLARAQAWVSLAQAEYWRGHYEQLLFIRAPALGACARVDDGFLQTELLLMVGGALNQLGRPAEAQPLFEQAVALRRKLYGPADRRLAAALGAFGNALSMQGDLQAGIPAHREALEISVRTLGAAHPNVGVASDNLADDYLYGLRAPEAVEAFEQGVGVLERANGPKSRDVAVGATDLGFAYLETGQPARALETFERTEALWAELVPTHPLRAMCLLGRFEALEALGRHGSVAELEKALLLAKGLPPFERSRVQLALGLALGKAAEPRAISLVRQAREGLRSSTLPLIQRELGRAQGWLSAHGGGS